MPPAILAQRVKGDDVMQLIQPPPSGHMLTFRDVPDGKHARCLVCGRAFVDVFEYLSVPCRSEQIERRGA